MGDSDEDYEFEYSDEEEEEGDVDVENTYFNAKSLKSENAEEAIKEFARVAALEAAAAGGGGRGEWGFRALKQQIKLLFRLGPGRHPAMMERYRELLEYTRGSVTQNRSEKGVNMVLDLVSSSRDWGLLGFIYETTLAALEQNKNDRLWFKTNLKLGHLLFQMGDERRLQSVIKELLRHCGAEEGGGGDDAAAAAAAGDAGDGGGGDAAGAQLQEVLALQVQVHERRRDHKRCYALAQRALQVRGGLPHPRTLARLLEAGGRAGARAGDFRKAGAAFYQAFKSYDEAGEPRRLRCLQYLVLASMLDTSSTIDPFAGQETRAYKNHPEIQAMTDLVTAFSSNDVREFEKVLRVHGASLMEDSFIRDHVDDLLVTIRTQVLIKAIRPYTKVSINYLAQELNDIPTKDVENLLVLLILDGKVGGKIDQVNGVYIQGKGGNEINGGNAALQSRAAAPSSPVVNIAAPQNLLDASSELKRSQALIKWADTLSTVHRTITMKVNNKIL